MNHLNLLSADDVLAPRYATDEEIALVHDPHYIELVKKQGETDEELPQAASYGLGTEDVPIFRNMHQSTSLIVGGTLKAVETVMS